MMALVFVGVVGVTMCVLAGRHNERWGLRGAMLLVTIFLALRYEYGPDYDSYLDAFYGRNLLWMTFEPGWLMLNAAFRPLGFFAMVAALAILNGIVYLRLIERYVSADLRWFAFFLYAFNPDLLVTQASTMRQSVAVLFFLVALECVLTGRPVIYLTAMLAAVSFHYSAIVLVPTYAIRRAADGPFSRRAAGLLYLTYGGLFILGGWVYARVSSAFPPLLQRYLEYTDTGAVNTGLGLVIATVLFFLTVHYQSRQRDKYALIFAVAAFGFLLIPMGLIVQMTARLTMYFGVLTLIVYPRILQSMKSAALRVAFSSALLAFTTFQFVRFFDPNSWTSYFINYRTILSADGWH
jgi:transmembrane protein EpsG